VAFTSTASNLVAEDTNGKNDIFVNEWSKNKLTRVSIPGYSGGESNGDSYGASISADGNRVVFYSYASNLVLDDTNKKTDIFMFDFLNPETIRVSLTPDSLQANNDSGSPAISPDGYFLAFDSIANDLVIGDENGTSDVFLHIFGSGTELVSKTSSSTPGNAGSYYPSISEYGNSVAFVSAATDLVAGDTNGFEDVFVFDRILGVLTRISVPSTQSQASVSPSISADGRYVAFVSAASNLVMGDSNGKSDVFVHDRQSVTNTLVSVRTDGFQANSDSFNPTISRDGRYVVFHSDANNLVTGDSNIRSDVFVHDRQMSTTIRVSVNSVGNQADDVSQSASISFDGRFVAFESYASNLVTDDNNGVADIFVRDFLNGTTTRLSVDSNKVQSNGPSHRPSISGNGLFVAFESEATNLVSGDEYNVIDIFVRDIEAGTTSRVSIANNGDESNWHSSYPSITGDRTSTTTGLGGKSSCPTFWIVF
jgi:Tol biopolymer transport system component